MEALCEHRSHEALPPVFAAAMWETASAAGLGYVKADGGAVVMEIVERHVAVRRLAVNLDVWAVAGGRAPVLAADVVTAWMARVSVLRGRRREVDAR